MFETTQAIVWSAVRAQMPTAPVVPRPPIWMCPPHIDAPSTTPVVERCGEPLRSDDTQHPFDRVLDALRARGRRVTPNRDRQGRESVRAQCPAHVDRKPSLVVTRDGDRVLLTCWAGCTPERLHGAKRVQKIADALGIRASDLFSGPTQPPAPPRVVATYDYRAIDGSLIGKKVRLAPKGFRWRQHSPAVGPYRLPDLIDTQTVFLTEGEKGCDRLWALGIAATCGPLGASRWMSDWSLDLWTVGCRELIVLADNDQAGRHHAEEVAKITHALDVAEPIEVKLVTLPGLAPKADVVDWLDAGHDGDELLRIAAETPVWSPGLTEQQRLARRRQLTRQRVQRHREKRRMPASPDIRSVTDALSNVRSVTPPAVTRNAVTLADVLRCTSQESVLRNLSIDSKVISFEVEVHPDAVEGQGSQTVKEHLTGDQTRR